LVRKLLLAAGVAALSLSAPGTGFAKTKADATFSFPKDEPIRIILFRPDMEVSSLGTSGLPTPNPDWTADARRYLQEAFGKSQSQRSIEIMPMSELAGDDASYLAEYQSLFRAVGSSVMLHNYALKLPSKKMANGKYAFDWTLGPGVKHLGELGGGKYGLFVYGYDAYATSGRKAMQIFTLIASSAMGFGMLPQGGQHYSYASLVDLETGNIVWFNFFADKKGDVRTAEGAQVRADKLLATLPLRVGEVRPKAATTRR
jgi:hypothetical protein